jgi:Fe-S cluster assembly protein SufD
VRKGWFLNTRRDAISRFAELGFPTTRHEEWRYTNVAPIARTPFKHAAHPTNGITAADFAPFTFGEVDCCQLVFINGFFCASLSTLPELPRGVRVRSLAASVASDRSRLEPSLGRHADYRDNAFTALNTAFMRDGAFIFLPAGTVLKEVVHLVFLSTAPGGPSITNPRNLIVAGEGSRISIVETHAGLGESAYFTNTVSEVVAGPGSIIDYCKLQRETEAAFHISTLHVTQDRDSTFTSHSISLGGSLARNDVNVVMNAEGGDCTLNGLYVTGGTQHADNHTTLVHARPNCTSRELYKGILDNSSTGVFNGRIVVRKDAQKTNSRQTNRNLLLSEEALVNTKPQLEIFADDVKCTHGATIGRLNEEELFYLRSRGIGEQAARTLLTYAFATEVIGAVNVKPIQCQLDLVLMNRLSKSRGVGGETEAPIGTR